MPSKTLLRAPELVAASARAPGVTAGALDPERIFWWRDQVVENFDDAGHAEWLAGLNVDLVRGVARVARPGALEVDGRELGFEKLVVATGSSPAIPPIDGLEDVEYWTSRDATSASAVPESLTVLGAGAVGCELAQFYARLGTRVVLLSNVDRILPREDAEAAAIVARGLEEDGVELRFGAQTERIAAGIRLHLAGGETIEAERLLVATGRRANVDGLGLEQLGVRIGPKGVEVDERLRAAENVWAIGDVNGIALFTHVGKYQARVAAADVVGDAARADYRAVPAVIFTDPQLAAVGRTQGDGLVFGRRRLPARLSTYERPRREGFLKIVADPDRRVLVGAVAVGPEAGEWLQQLTLAIRAEVPLDVLRDTIQPYPTFSEAVYFAVRDLDV